MGRSGRNSRWIVLLNKVFCLLKDLFCQELSEIAAVAEMLVILLTLLFVSSSIKLSQDALQLICHEAVVAEFHSSLLLLCPLGIIAFPFKKEMKKSRLIFKHWIARQLAPVKL